MACTDPNTVDDIKSLNDIRDYPERTSVSFLNIRWLSHICAFLYNNNIFIHMSSLGFVHI